MRIEKERTPLGKDELAIKTEKGGLMDAEFIALVFSLARLARTEHLERIAVGPGGRPAAENR